MLGTYGPSGPSGPSLALVACSCAAGAARAKAWRGLPPDGEGVLLATLKPVKEQAPALLAIDELLADPCGWLTLAGDYGVGKTQLIYAVLNELAARGIYGQYWTMTRILDHLRDGFRDASGRAQSARITALEELPVLAIDELDKYHATEWAESAVFRLLDRRYQLRDSTVTLLAYNRDRADQLPPFLRSRMHDGRFRLVELRGKQDLRRIAERPARAAAAGKWDRGEGES